MHKVRNNNSPNYLAQLFISHSPTTSTPEIPLRAKTKALKLAYPSLELPASRHEIMYFSSYFKCNLHKYMSENNLSTNLDGFESFA